MNSSLNRIADSTLSPYFFQFSEDYRIGYRNQEIIYSFSKEDKFRIKRDLDEYRTNVTGSLLNYPIFPFPRDTSHCYRLSAGNTPLHKLKRISETYGVNVSLKCEHLNPSGSFKDRETVATLLSIWEKGIDRAIIYSSGNAACSAAYFCDLNKRPFLAIVPGDIYPEKLDYMLKCNARVIVLGDENTIYEEGYKLYINALNILSSKTANFEDVSVTNPFRSEGGKTISFEIVNQLGQVPDFIIAPSANGSLVSGLWKGFEELFEIGYIQHLPQLVSVGMQGASPIYDEINEYDQPNLPDNMIDVLNVGSTLAASESYDLYYAVRALKKSNGLAVQCSGQDILQSYNELENQERTLVEEYQLLLEPCSMTPFVALKKLAKHGVLKKGHQVVLLSTGDGQKSKSLLNEIISETSIFRTIANNRKHDKDSPIRGHVLRIETNLEKLVDTLLSVIL